ncbi:MAG: MBL fold metallo-hydrolase [Catenulispora sp.]|nr:MBL fold metallo-hydrolase [Catenulispora sp.]
MSSSHPHDDRMPPGQAVEIADGVFAYIQPDGSWWINNTAFLVGGQGVISIDSCSTERRTREYLSAIRTVTDRPIRALVNTHHHGDHTHGNHLLSPAAVIGHEAMREAMIAAGLPSPAYGAVWGDVPWGELELEPPFVTFTDRLTLHVDGVRCEVANAGTPAHTVSDSYVWIPDHSVLISGDLLFNGGTPFLLMGSVAGAVDVLENQIKPLGAQTIVPGHGGICGPEVIDDVLAYLRHVLAVAEQGKEAGLTPLEAAREIGPGDFADLLDSERLVGNLHRAYAELDGAAPGAEIDLFAALIDMVTYNGGKPLRCLA